jgi:pimeloyl-ACP methyl ester carboxylesterase
MITVITNGTLRMGRAGPVHAFWFAFLAAALILGGCTRVPSAPVTTIKAESFGELQGQLQDGVKSDVELFRSRGPFPVTTETDRELRLSRTERIRMDVYLSGPPERAPLVIFLHGHDSSKRAHAYQAEHLASWGMHCISVQLPPQGPWLRNGRTLTRVVRFIYRSPQAVSSRIDVNRIILVGHSFGASAVSIALAEGAPVAGAILLDPAAVGRELPQFLRKVDKPVMVLGADDELAYARNRDFFYDYVRGRIAEVSIKDATHEDAQYPSEFALRNFGFDPDTTEEAQMSFVSALTSAAVSLSTTGAFDYAWTTFGPAVGNGRFFNPRRK